MGLLIFGTTLMLLGAHGEALESFYLQNLAKARTVQDVELQKDNYRRLRVAQIACQLQKEAGEVPFICYEAEALAQRLGWIDTRTETQVRFAQLDKLCFAAAQRLRIPSMNEGSLSVRCRRKLKEARKIQAYRSEEAENWSGF